MNSGAEAEHKSGNLPGEGVPLPVIFLSLSGAP